MTAAQYKKRACPICESVDSQPEVRSRQPAEALAIDALRPFWSGLYQEKLFFSYHRCGGCGLLYNPVFFDEAQLSDLYSRMAPNMDVVATDAIAATQRGYFDHAAKRGLLAGGYLEIGPDIGHVVSEAARHGTFDRFWLFEPNIAIHAALRAASGGLPTHLSADMGDLSPVPDGSVGLAVMVHVLDHLLDPVEMLAQIRAKLRPGGTLMIVTHNESSVLRRLMGVRWPPFCLQHPELYNPGTIRKLLQRAGYSGIDVARSSNHFPIDFIVRQAAWSARIDLGRVMLPKRSIRLRLGNIITLATAPGQAAGASRSKILETAA